MIFGEYFFLQGHPSQKAPQMCSKEVVLVGMVGMSRRGVCRDDIGDGKMGDVKVEDS